MNDSFLAPAPGPLQGTMPRALVFPAATPRHAPTRACQAADAVIPVPSLGLRIQPFAGPARLLRGVHALRQRLSAATTSVLPFSRNKQTREFQLGAWPPEQTAFPRAPVTARCGVGVRHTSGMQAKPRLDFREVLFWAHAFPAFVPGAWNVGVGTGVRTILRLRGGSCVPSRAGTTGGRRQGPLPDGRINLLFKLKENL
ncbi:hypothetical protein HJG60_008444 [Phyllostomus discolor]|uniref:Uncharacterized protein n=1 Tax=Phyllostomus discolor TaxID=89673 RepID=A0A833Z509_9CHIR|nr:hypothetical protein HJG60_008444 [Phyllostomus discolor]